MKSGETYTIEGLAVEKSDFQYSTEYDIFSATKGEVDVLIRHYRVPTLLKGSAKMNYLEKARAMATAYFESQTKFEHELVMKVTLEEDQDGEMYVVYPFSVDVSNWYNRECRGSMLEGKDYSYKSIVPVYRAFAAMHEADVVHGGLSPHAIWKFIEGQTDYFITDFGYESDHSKIKISKAFFRPPESQNGGGAGKESDVFSMAGCIYWFTNGTFPFANLAHMKEGKQQIPFDDKKLE